MWGQMENLFGEIFDRLDEFILEHGYDGYRHLYSLATLGAFPGILNVLGFKLNRDGYYESRWFAFKYKPKMVSGSFDSIVAYEMGGNFVERKYFEINSMSAVSIENHLRDLNDFNKKSRAIISLKKEEKGHVATNLLKKSLSL